MNKQSMIQAEGKILRGEGSYQDLAALGEYYFCRLGELGMAIEEAGKNGDSRYLTEGLGITVTDIANKMASFLGHEVSKHCDDHQGDSSHSVKDLNNTPLNPDLGYISVIARSTSRLLDAAEIGDAIDMTVTASQALKQIAMIAESQNK